MVDAGRALRVGALSAREHDGEHGVREHGGHA